MGRAGCRASYGTVSATASTPRVGCCRCRASNNECTSPFGHRTIGPALLLDARGMGSINVSPHRRRQTITAADWRTR